MEYNNAWKNFLISDLAGKVISVFKDVFLGIYFLICSAQKITYSLCLKRYKESSWLITLATGILILVIGIVVMFAKGDGVISAIGISYLGFGLLNIINVILLRKRSSYFLA